MPGLRRTLPALRDAVAPTPLSALAGGGAERDRTARVPGLAWAALCAAALAVAVGVALGRAPLNLYDVSFSLDWGSDVLHGLVPDVHVSGASTPHPLSIVLGAVAALFGSSALDVMRVLLLACTGVAAVSLFRIGALTSSRLAGAAAVAVLLLSEPFLYATVGQATPSDLPSLAAVLAALACELARPRRGVAPLVLLSVAGLWRPEPWLLALLYWAWVARGRPRATKLRLAAIALSAPVLWMAGDLAMTHDPLYSLAYTHESALAGQRPTGLAHAAGIMSSALSSYLGTPALIASLAAVAIELVVRKLPRLLLVLLAVSVLSFALVGAAGLPLQERYVLPTTVLLAVFFGHLITGWLKLPRSPLRQVWMLAALAAAGLMIANAPRQLHAFASDRATFARQSAIIAGLGKLTRSHGLRARLRACGPIAAPYRVVPILAYDIGQRPRALTTQDAGIPAHGALVLPNSAEAAQLFETHRFVSYSLARHGYALLAENSAWKIWTRCAPA
jgi:hypothetical protein